MKKTISLLFLSLSFTFCAYASVPFNTLVPIKNVLIPSSITSLEESQFYISGWLPNACHKKPIISHSINEYKEIRIKVEAISYHDSNPYCPPKVTPFNHKVNLGKLHGGDYQIIINEGSVFQENDSFTISDIQVGSEPLEFATIENVRMVERSRNILSIEGSYLFCQELKEFKFLKDQNKNVFNIIPIVTAPTHSCSNKEKFFSYDLEFPDNTTPGEKLIHVKSKGLNLNYIFYIR